MGSRTREPSTGACVLRGGPLGVRAIHVGRRAVNPPAYKDFFIGFRTARSLPRLERVE